MANTRYKTTFILLISLVLSVTLLCCHRAPTTSTQLSHKLNTHTTLPNTTTSTSSKTSTTPRLKVPNKPSITPLSKRFAAKQTFAFILPQIKPVKGVGGVRAKQCAACHTDIYKEWSQSTHASALADIQYQTELAKPSSPTWLCLNCHAPVQNQRAYIVTGLYDNNVLKPVLTPNPGFDKELQKEAITCATCHIRRDKKGESVIIGAIGSKYAPHPIKKDKASLRNVCLRCHNPQGKRLTRHLVCWFHTKKEHSQSKYDGKKDCVDCHMPTKQRRLVPSMTHLPKRLSHRHHWVGGGIPKWYKGYKTLLQRGYKPSLKVHTTLPKTLTPGSEATFSIRLHNASAGHWLPTADPERFLLIDVSLYTAKQKRLLRKTYRIGQTWKWEPQAKKIADNRLKADETRTWTTTLTLPKQLKGHIVRVKAYHVRLSTKTSRYMKKHATPSDKWLKKASYYVKHIGKYYPHATLIHQEDIELETQQRTRLNLHELIKASQQEQHKPLHLRDY
ncbi:MAG: cytochrome C554 and C-prime [Deltaproteobacteria bacterium]|nr:cytochrome C554 and C-prime [Deltaproteobacteria bacterium]